MAPRRFTVRLPTPGGVSVQRRWAVYTLRDNRGVALVAPVGTVGRRRRAAAEDLWHKCQSGGDCIEDVKRKYTNTTVADRILQLGGSAVYLGGLTIGTGAGTAEAGGAGGVPWPGVYPGAGTPDSFIPLERPFRLPTADLPVQVAGATEPPTVPAPPSAPENTFINPAFEGDEVVSISSTDDVVIASPSPAPLPDAVPGPPPVLEFPDGPYTRGDTFATDYTVTGEVAPGNNPFVPQRLSEPDAPGPFLELQLLGRPMPEEGGTLFEESALDTWDDDIPLLSTPRRGGQSASARARTVEFANPTYEAEYVDQLFRQGVAEETAALISPEDAVAALGTPRLRGSSSGTVSVTRTLRTLGMRLRSGLRVPYTTHLVGDLSPIVQVGEASSMQLRSFAPLGSADVFVHDLGMAESSLTHTATLPWDGSPIDVTDVIFGAPDPGFTDIPLDDPFPEMEIDEDDVGLDDSSAVPDLSHAVRSGAHAGTLSVQRAGRGSPYPMSGDMRPVGPGSSSFIPIGPGVPGVLVFFYDSIDPSLFWWFLRKRRRLHRLFYR